jgi:replicative DNA helicase
VAQKATMSGDATDVRDQAWPAVGEPFAEAAVLGCILRGSAAVARSLLDHLSDGDWIVPAHADVAAAAQALLEQGVPVDAVTVLGQLRRQGLRHASTAHQDAGVLLVELCQAAPCWNSAQHYLQIVLEHSYRRRVQEAAFRLQEAAATGSVAGLVELVEREHTALTAAQKRITTPRNGRADP